MSEHVSRVRKLYKLILRLHRGLPDELRILGDNYAKDEFKRHKNCKPEEARIFLNEWREYAVTMSRQSGPARPQRPAQVSEAPNKAAGRASGPAKSVAGTPNWGKEIPVTKLVSMDPEQLLQLYQLHVSSISSRVADEGVELMAADVLNKKLREAKEHLMQLAEDEKGKLERGEISKSELKTITASWWLEMFDSVMVAHDVPTPVDFKGLSSETLVQPVQNKNQAKPAQAQLDEDKPTK